MPENDGTNHITSQQEIASLGLFYILTEDMHREALMREVEKRGFSVIDNRITSASITKHVEQLNVLTANQRILLLTYLHLYCVMQKIDIMKDVRLTQIMELLDIDTSFSRFVFQRMQGLRPDIHIIESEPVQTCINPNERLSKWATGVAVSASKEGRYVRKAKIKCLQLAEYEHPDDKTAKDLLEDTPFFSKIVGYAMKNGLDQYFRIMNMGSYIRTTKTDYPYLHKLLESACSTLDIPIVPELYIRPGYIGAETYCSDCPIIVLSSASLSLLSHEELLFLIGHELGHIKSKHVLYRQMVNVIPIIAERIGESTLGLGRIAIEGTILSAAKYWKRKSELTADRAGLLATQNPDAGITLLMKTAGMPVKNYDKINPFCFIDQAKEFKNLGGNINDVVQKLSIMMQDHPWSVERAASIIDWVEDGSYKNVMRRRKLYVRSAITAENIPTSIADYESFSRDPQWFELAKAAILRKDELAIDVFLEYYTDISCVDDNGDSLLMAAVETSNERVVQQLLEKGSNVNIQNIKGETVLHKAVRAGNIKVLSKLLVAGADITKTDNTDNTPFSLATSFGYCDMMLQLIYAGQDINLPDKNKNIPLIHAITHKQIDAFRILVEHGANINALCQSNIIALSVAASLGLKEVCVSLLKTGTNIDHRDVKGRTPLWEAVFNNQVEVVKLLLENGANTEIADYDELNAPLIMASKQKSEELVRLLLGYGARVNVRNKENKSAMSYALGSKFLGFGGNDVIASMLEQKGAPKER